MNWFNFTSPKRKYRVSLNNVSREFGMSRFYIINLLTNAGYNNISNLPYFKLNNDHLEIILSAYSQALKSYYKESSKNFDTYDYNKQEQLKKFFFKFIKRNFLSGIFGIDDITQNESNNRIFHENLDSETIRNYFYSVILQIQLHERIGLLKEELNDELYLLEVNSTNSTPPFIFREIKWRLNINHTFNDIKSQIFTTIITGHYYIFTAEEDLFTAFLTSLKRCFSAVKQTLGEALKYNNSNFNQLCRTTYLPL